MTETKLVRISLEGWKRLSYLSIEREVSRGQLVERWIDDEYEKLSEVTQ